MTDPRPVQRYLDRLRDIPFVKAAEAVSSSGVHDGFGDSRVRIVTPGRTKTFLVELKKSHLTRALVDGIAAQATSRGRQPWILFAPHVGRPLAAYLAELGVNFVDLAGNCRLEVGANHYAYVEGRPPERRPQQGRGSGAPGMQVVFAVLVEPGLLDGPVRRLAQAAGVAPTTAAERIAQLRREGLVHDARGGKRLTDRRRLLDLWIKGYETIVRPKLMIGRFRVRETDPGVLDRQIEHVLGEKKWAFGGAAAAHRLTGYYRSGETVIHLEDRSASLAKQLGALRADEGPLILMGAPGPIAFEKGLNHAVAPLLAYTELLVSGDKRARDAAVELQQRYLDWIT